MKNTVQKNFLGLLYGISSAALFVAMALIISANRQKISLDEILITRGIVGIIFGLVIFSINKKTNRKKRSVLPVFGRAFFGATSLACYAWNLRSGRVASSTLFSDLSPPFVLLILVVVGHLKLSRSVLFGFVLCIAAVYILHVADIQGMSNSGLAIGLLGALSGALAYISLSRAAGQFSASEILIGLSAMLILFGLSLRLLDSEGFAFHLSLDTAKPLLEIALISILAQLTLAWSFRKLSTHSASLMTLLATPFALFAELVSTSHIEASYVVAMTLGAFGAGLLARERMRSR